MSRFEKKVVAIFIAIFMVLSNLSTGSVVVNAQEAEEYTVAVCDEEMIGTISEADGNITYAFTPSATGEYTVKTVGDMDTYGEIYDSAKNLIYSDNDSGDDLNYAIDASLEEGQTYYITSSMFSEVETGDITTIITMKDAPLADTADVVEEATDSDATETVEPNAENSVTEATEVAVEEIIEAESSVEIVEAATLTDAGETVSADEVYVSGDYKYKVLADNTVNIVKYNGTATTVNIPEIIDGKTVKSLGVLVFGGNNTVTSVSVPNTVTEMQYGVFCGTSNLKTVKFASGSKLDYIGTACFSMSGIENITIPGSVKNIDEFCFWECDNLKSISIPSSVTNIGNSAFAFSDSLSNVVIGDGVTVLNSRIFSECRSLEKFTIPKNVKVIDNSCFSRSGLKTIIWNDKITTIGDSAFYCTQLTEVTIPDSVTSIGKYAFALNEKLKKVVIGDNIINISRKAFTGCAIESIDFGNAKIIETEAFYGNESLKAITIPETVTDIQYKAFMGCTELSSIDLPNNIQRVDGNAFGADYVPTAWYNAQKDGVLYVDNVLYGYKGEMPANTKLVVKDGVKVVAGVSFAQQQNLVSVELPYGVTHINEYAFFECDNMKSILIPSSVTEIADYSVGYCYADGDDGVVQEGNIGAAYKSEYPFSHFKAKVIDGFVIIGDKGTAAEAYAIKHGITFKQREIPTVNVKYRTHVQSIGWQNYVSNGTMAGTSGKAKRLEGINIYVEGNPQLGIQYTTHCQSYGWLPWSADGDMNGTEKEAKRLEAIMIKLTGADANLYDVYYRVHAQTYGWLNWAKNGEASGTAGYSKRLEGIQIVIVKKGEKINEKLGGISSKQSKAYIAKAGNSPVLNNQATSNTTPVVPGTDTPNVAYRTHVQKYGWQGWKYNGQMSGTSGEAKRLEGIEIKLTNKPYEGGIVYTTHVQKYGWQGKLNDQNTWKSNGAMSGTSGEAKRLEAICINLTGEMAEHYDVYYRVHAQSYGWLGWAKNGECSGTAGYGKRLEGIQIVLVKKGDPVPTIYYGNITSKVTKPYISKN